MKKLIVCLSLAAVLLLGMGGVTACEKMPDEPVVLRLSTTLPPAQSAILEEMVERFNERAEGTNYSIEFYPGGVLASMEEAMDMVRTGAVDMAETGLATAMTHDARFGAGGGIPFLIDDIDANVIYVEIINEALFADICEEDFNQKIVAAWLSPPLYYCGVKPVKTLEDWDGKLIHTMSPLQSQAVEVLGASSVSLPFFDVVPSMEKGVVDGGVNLNAYVINMMNWFDSFDYITVADMFCGHLILSVNLDVFNDMPNSVQEMLLEEGEWAGQALTDFAVSGRDTALQACADYGIDVYYLPDTERNRWVDATRSIVDDYFAQLDPDVVSIIQDAADEANE